MLTEKTPGVSPGTFTERKPLWLHQGTLSKEARIVERSQVQELVDAMGIPGSVIFLDGLARTGKITSLRLAQDRFGYDRSTMGLDMGFLNVLNGSITYDKGKMWRELTDITMAEMDSTRRSDLRLKMDDRSADPKSFFFNVCLPELVREKNYSFNVAIRGMDDIDYNSPFGKIASDFLTELILGIRQNSIASLVLVGNSLSENPEKKDELKPFVNQCTHHITIPFFNPDQTNFLARAGNLTYEPEALDQLQFLTGGHPFFVQAVLFEIEHNVENGMKKSRRMRVATPVINKAAVDDIISRVISDRKGAGLWGDNYYWPKQIDQLSIDLNRNERNFLLEQAKKSNLGISAPRDAFAWSEVPTDIATSLTDKGLLTSVDEKYYYRIPMVQLYLQTLVKTKVSGPLPLATPLNRAQGSEV